MPSTKTLRHAKGAHIANHKGDIRGFTQILPLAQEKLEIGPPVATKSFSSKELSDVGIIGVYAKEDIYQDDVGGAH